MGLVKEVLTVVWKNVAIQDIRRHYITLFFEIFAVLLFSVNLKLVHYDDGSLCWLEEKVYRGSVAAEHWWPLGRHELFIYGPQSGYNDQLMEEAFEFKSK